MAIIKDIMGDTVFPCHETVEYANDGSSDADASNSRPCIGSAILLENDLSRGGCRANFSYRLAIMVGHLDPDNFDKTDVYETAQEFIETTSRFEEGFGREYRSGLNEQTGNLFQLAETPFGYLYSEKLGDYQILAFPEANGDYSAALLDSTGDETFASSEGNPCLDDALQSLESGLESLSLTQVWYSPQTLLC